MSITKDDIIELLKNGRRVLGDFAMGVFTDAIDKFTEEKVSDAIDKGIENTISALYDANVNDNEIIRVVNKYWRIDIAEVEEGLVWEKSQAPIRSLEQYLRREGLSRREIDDFMMKSHARAIIERNRDLWKLKDNPEKLFNLLKKNSKN